MATSRRTVREALKTALETALAGTVKTVTDHKTGVLVGQTPLVSVLSAGSNRPRITFQGTMPSFLFEVHVWVRQASGAWTNQDAENTLDAIEALIGAAYADNQDYLIEYAADSTIIEVTVSNEPYYFERIPTRVTLTRS